MQQSQEKVVHWITTRNCQDPNGNFRRVTLNMLCSNRRCHSVNVVIHSNTTLNISIPEQINPPIRWHIIIILSFLCVHHRQNPFFRVAAGWLQQLCEKQEICNKSTMAALTSQGVWVCRQCQDIGYMFPECSKVINQGSIKF